MENEKSDWARFEREWTAQIVHSINFVRSQQGLTVKDLALRLRSLGWPVSDATLSGMLSGNKRTSVSVAELTIFARALSVAPLYLLLGLPTATLFPDHKSWPKDSHNDIYGVAAWFTGVEGPYYQDDPERVNEAKSARSAAGASLYFLQRTTEVSPAVWNRAEELAALKTLDQSVAREWIEPKIKSCLGELEYFLQVLRRIRGRMRKRAQSNPLADITFLPMPDIFAFVDTEAPIVTAIEAIPTEALVREVSSDRVEAARSKLEEEYFEWTESKRDMEP